MACNDGRCVHCFTQAVPLLGMLHLMEIPLLNSHIKYLHLEVCWGQGWVSSVAQTRGEGEAADEQHPRNGDVAEFLSLCGRAMAVLQGRNLQMDEPVFQNQEVRFSSCVPKVQPAL